MAKKKLPKELDQLVKEVKKLDNELLKEESKEIPITERKGYWDFPLSVEIQFFDPLYSYEITGYRPINETQGLDFDPNWFIETRKVYEQTGKYCTYLFGSKKFREFWREQYIRCKNGYTVNGYTITGDHYFFLNFYTLPLVDKVEKSGGGRPEGFPNFSEAQYQWFHYYEMAKRTRKHCNMMKARGVGFSEINASMAACMFTIIRQSMSIIACHDQKKVGDTLKKVWHAMAFLDNETDGGMHKNKQLKNTDTEKQAGEFIQQNGNKIPTGWQSTVRGINADDPQKIRGDRADLLIYDEAGSWPDLLKAVIQGEALVNIGGSRFGIKIIGGTGGDKGPNLAGLKEIYYNPEAYDVLPFRHSYTQTGEVALTGFFIPAFAQVWECLDKRGFCDKERAKKILQKDRDKFLNSPEGLIQHCAEYCWNAEEAFNLEGDNKFNRILITDQLAEIRLHKRGPRPERGNLEYIFKTGKQTKENIDGFKWTPNDKSKLQILEHPIWSSEFKHSPTYKFYDPESIGNQYNEMRDLYIAGVDGIDIGANDTSKETRDPSDFCIVILKRMMGLQEPQIVAMYKDRPGDEREAFKIAIRLCQYYNAKVNIEATRKSFYTWAKDKGYGNFFVRRPKATMTSDLSRTLSNQIGTPATKQIIEQHTSLTANFVEDYCHTIWFEEILQELMSYNDENKTKFDIVASLGMVFLLDQELSQRVPTEVKKEVEAFEDFGYYTDERGYKRWGVIPKDNKQLILNDNRNVYDPRRIDSSDPRHHQMLAQSGVYW